MKVVSFQRLGDALVEFCDPSLVDHLTRWNLHELYRFAGCTLDRLQHAFFTRCYKHDCITAAAGATSSANAMNIGFCVIGNIVIQNVTDSFYIKAACSNISCDNNIKLTFLKLIDGAFAEFLLNITIQGCAGVAACFQFFREFTGGNLGAYEDKHGIEVFSFKNSCQGIQFIAPANLPVSLADGFCRRGFNLDGDMFGVL